MAKLPRVTAREIISVLEKVAFRLPARVEAT
jgi:predicted RNA binding protein YcfA (HicA-like mRNA interferase family)